MDFKEKYQEALERAKKGLPIVEVFPELKESEDEMIRKEIVDFIYWAIDRGSITKKQLEMSGSWIAYLEKKKEYVSNNFDEVWKREDCSEIIAEGKKLTPEFEALFKKVCHAWYDKGIELEKLKEQNKCPKDIEVDAVQFCFDNGINLTPLQAKKIATHYLMIGHNNGYVEGRKNAHIPAKELGLPSSMDYQQEWSKEDEKALKRAIDCVRAWEIDYCNGDNSVSERLKSFKPQPKSKQELSDGYKEDKSRTYIESYTYKDEELRTRVAFYTYKDEDGVLYLSNLFVEETSRNQGFGTKILKAAEKFAEAIGAICIRLKVKQDSFANAWYRKNGYGYMTFEDGYDWLEKTLEYLKPHWKPSEEQMEYLAASIEESNENPVLESLYNDLKELL